MSLVVKGREKNLELFISDYFAPIPYKPISYKIVPMQGDAGLRHYYRVILKDKNYVLMDCPPSYASIKPFIDIAEFLLENGFSAPQIIRHDIEQGFILLEDFGDISLKKHLENTKNNNQERRDIYRLIIDLLCELQKKECPAYLKNYDNELLCSELELFVSWYIPYEYNRELTELELGEFKDICRNSLAQQDPLPASIVLRDYHLENMMYLDERNSIRKIGLLDFQDALCGSPIYDLVSVLEDARVDVPLEEAQELIDYFALKKRYDKESVLRNYHILGAQRNLRILGVFARKYLRDKDDGYLKYIPRVKKYLENDLSHPNLNKMKNWFNNLK